MDVRLEALYRDLVKQYGKEEADRRLRAAQDTATSALDALIQQNARARAQTENRPPKGPPPIAGSVFVTYLGKDVELWQLPRSQAEQSP